MRGAGKREGEAETRGGEWEERTMLQLINLSTKNNFVGILFHAIFQFYFFPKALKLH